MAASATNMKTKKTFGQWFKSRKVQQWLVIVSFMIVPVLLLLVFSYVPFAKMFEFSLYKMKSYDSKNNTYVGFKNYIDVFTRDDCFNSLKLAIISWHHLFSWQWHCILQQFCASR